MYSFPPILLNSSLRNLSSSWIGFKSFYLHFSCGEIFRVCCTRISGLWCLQLAQAVVDVVSFCSLGTWVCYDYRSRWGFLVLSLFNECFVPWFLFLLQFPCLFCLWSLGQGFWSLSWSLVEQKPSAPVGDWACQKGEVERLQLVWWGNKTVEEVSRLTSQLTWYSGSFGLWFVLDLGPGWNTIEGGGTMDDLVSWKL